MTYHAKVIAGGKIVIPADLRREMGIQDGDVLVIERHPTGIKVKTYAQVVQEVQRDMQTLLKPDAGNLVDELIDDRRRDAVLERSRDEQSRPRHAA